MAVKHVTIYECDVCKAHVDAKGLTPVKVGLKATEVCDKCLRKVERVLDLDHPTEEGVELSSDSHSHSGCANSAGSHTHTLAHRNYPGSGSEGPVYTTYPSLNNASTFANVAASLYLLSPLS